MVRLTTFMLAFFVSLSIYSETAATKAAQFSRESDTIKAREEALRQAELHYDVAAAVSILADSFVLISASDGKLKTKEEFLPLIGDKDDPMEALEYGDMVVHIYGDAAVVFSSVHEKFLYKGKPIEYRGPRTAVWIKQNNRWTLVAIHASSYPVKPLM